MIIEAFAMPYFQFSDLFLQVQSLTSSQDIQWELAKNIESQSSYTVY